jgi:hypothetical protein
MDEHVRRIPVDQDAFNGEFQSDIVKDIEISLHVALKRIKAAGREEQVLERAPVMLYVGSTQRFDGGVDTDYAVMILLVLNRLGRAPEHQNQGGAGDETPDAPRGDPHHAKHGAV